MFIIASISLILGVLGGIGIIFTIKSYRSQKKTEHAYEQILTVAKQDWEGKYTEDEIVKLNAQLNDLTLQINNVIPQKARKALLEYKEEQLRIELETIYDEYNDIKKELSTLGIKSKLSPEIEANINSEINKKMGRSTYNNKLLVIIAAVLLLRL